jgi:HK97 family phage portal protein
MKMPSWLNNLNPLRNRATVPERTPGSTRFIMIPSQTGGMWVSEETAIQLSAVFACVSVISKALASSVFDVFEDSPDGERQPRRNSQLYKLLNVSPNPEMNAFEFREALVISALLWHGGYAEIERDEVVGRPINLWPLHPDRVTLDRDDAGALIYRIHNQTSADTLLASRDVFRIHGPGIDGLVGYRVARLAARTFGHAMAAETFGAAFYGNGAQMGATLETEANLTPEQVKQLEDSLAEHKGPLNSHLPLVLGGGAKWVQHAIAPEKAQFIETRFLLIEEVCRFFGVPPHKVAHLLRATFSNIEQQGLEFVRDALTPWAERLRQETDRKLRPVNKRAMHTRLDLEWLAEGDSKTKAEADSLLVNSGIMNRNEVRRRRGLNTIPDGDKHTVQLSMTTLEKIGEEPDPPPDDGAIVAPPDDGAMPDDPAPDDDDARAGLRVVE